MALELSKDSDNPVSLVALKAKVKEGRTNVLPIDVDMVTDLIKTELLHKSEGEIKDEIANVIDFLKTRKRRSTVIDTLHKSIHMIQDGKEMEGILLAKTVKFSDAQPLVNTVDLMSASVEETNVFPTGIVKFDKDLGGLAKGNMMSIAGDTGSLKTMASLWLCIQILKANPKFTCLYFEKEMPVKDIARRLAAYASGISVNKLMDVNLKEESKFNITQALSHDDEMRDVMNRLKIVPSGNFSNVSDMYRYIDTYNCDIWCLDFLTQLGAEDTSADFNRFTMAQASMLKNIIQETDTLGIVLNQVKKNSVRARPSKIPQLDDIEWSGAISQYSAYIFSTFFPSVYYSDAPDNFFYLYGLKNRHYRPIHVPLMANPAYCQFTPPAPREEPLMANWLQGYVTKAQESKRAWK
jgi:replicative DNA helicase